MNVFDNKKVDEIKNDAGPHTCITRACLASRFEFPGPTEPATDRIIELNVQGGRKIDMMVENSSFERIA